MDFKNVLMAIVLSSVVLIFWATFFEAPVVEQQTTEKQITKTENTSTPSIEEIETSKKISSIGKYLPENRKIDLLLSSAQKIDESGGVLAQLYLERAYSLYKEDYKKVKLIEDRIGDFTF